MTRAVLISGGDPDRAEEVAQAISFLCSAAASYCVSSFRYNKSITFRV